MLWVALFAGPVALAVRELASYALVKPACATGNISLLLLTGASMLGLTLAGTALAGLAAMRSRGGADDGGRVVDRTHFLAVVALGLNVLTALLIALSSIPEFVLSPCE